MDKTEKNTEYVYCLEKCRFMYRGLTCTEYAVRRYSKHGEKIYIPSGITLKKGTQKQCKLFCKKNYITLNKEIA